MLAATLKSKALWASLSWGGGFGSSVRIPGPKEPNTPALRNLLKLSGGLIIIGFQFKKVLYSL